ncbi:MAG: LCP family protein [Armatimonadetes bacterium]|nr:LCP family protein [Armatimonadota bacterium]
MALSRTGKPPARKKVRPRVRSARQWAGLVMLWGLMAGGAYIAYLYAASPVIRQAISQVVRQKGLSPKEAFGGKSRVNILLLGTDLNHDRRGRPITQGVRTDTIMVASVDFDRRKAAILSIPRDTRASIPGYGHHKINAAHAYGGPKMAVATVERLLGVGIDHYMIVNFQGFVRMIDLMGGIRVDVPKAMKYDDNWGNLHIDLKPGLQRLDGTQAMGFARFRHDAEGDVGRIRRQQEVAMAVRSRFIAPQTLIRLPALLDTVDRSFQGDMTYSQTLSLAYFLKSLPHDRIDMATVPGRYARVFWWPNKRQLRARTAAMFGEPEGG